MTAVGYAGGGYPVTSVQGEEGDVVLTPAEIGTLSTAQINTAISTAVATGIATRVLNDYQGASTLTQPLMRVRLTDQPATNDSNLLEFSYVSSAVERLTTWFNEVGHLRMERMAGMLFDHLVTLISSNADGTGNLLQFERRDGSNNRVAVGGFDQNGLEVTSARTWTNIATYDPGATGKWVSTALDGFGNTTPVLSVRNLTNDIVQFRGNISLTGTTSGGNEIAFVLPAGFAPSVPRYLNAGTSGGGAVVFEVMTDGNVRCRRASQTLVTISFDGLIYIK